MTQMYARFSHGHMASVLSLNPMAKINDAIQDDTNTNQEGG
jgi:hypothetical protein